MGRAKKNPEYDPERVMEQFTNCIVDAYGTGTDNNSLRKISEQFGITLMKTRKILITAGVYHTEISDQINSLREDNWSISDENMFEMAYIIYRESKVKEKTLEMFPSFKNIKNVLRQDVNLEKIVGEIENKTRKKSILDENRKDVFLSYNQHSKYADKIVEALEKRNLSVFRDTAEIRCGNNVVSKINEGLTKAKSILILLDDEYVNGSNWTRRELEVATIFSIEGGTVFLVVADDNEDFIENYPLLKPLCCGKLGKDMKELDDIVRDISEQWCNASTVQVIKERIRQSKVFVVFLSQSTLKSQWCPWELGYADALGKKICVYSYDDSDNINIPQFYEIYPRVHIDDKIWVDDGKNMEFSNWITFGEKKI